MSAPVHFAVTNPTPKTSAAEIAKKLENPGFGKLFTDHMAVLRYRDGEGWGAGTLEPYGPISLDPSAIVLHYGQSIFEGFKAYAQPGGGISTFRPEANAARFAKSAERLAMPPLPVETFVAAADALIALDRAWVPTKPGESLYMRPVLFATEGGLGVRPGKEYLFLMLASPSGAYFAKGVKPVTVWLSEDYVRAAPGGTGAAKCAGNYAASLVAQAEAQREGCDQVVWLDAVHREYVEEMGGMNLFFVFSNGAKTTLVTPELTGTLLPGITRDSLLTLGRDLGYETVERKITVREWREALERGELTEVFACGTAAVITPVGAVKSRHGGFAIGDGQGGPVAARLRQALLDVQHGAAPDPHGWMHKVV